MRTLADYIEDLEAERERCEAEIDALDQRPTSTYAEYDAVQSRVEAIEAELRAVRPDDDGPSMRHAPLDRAYGNWLQGG